jgi:hypothetical protein
MRRYYHSCVICPTCHEPYAGSYSAFVYLKLNENGTITCNFCNSEFNQLIDFSNKKQFQETYRTIDNDNFFHSSKEINKVPLYWCVEPNTIETSYIEWVVQKPQGVFLITWPWEDVRFIPILLSEYLTKNPNSNIVVIGNYDKHIPDTNQITCYSLPEIIFNTLFVDDPVAPSGELKKEINNFRREKSLLFNRRIVTKVKFKSFGSRRIDESICLNSLKKCAKERKKQITDGYGTRCLRDIKLTKLDGRTFSGYSQTDLESGKVDPENGKWILQLREENQWSGNQNYNHIWLYEILSNLKNLIRCQDYLKPSVYYLIDGEDRPKPGKTHLISSHSDPNQIFRLIREIQPDLLIIENADLFIQDIRYHGLLSQALLEYIKNPVNTTLLFSTDPEKRQFYHLNSPKNAFIEAGCKIHTLDSVEVMKHIGAKSTENNYPSPLSSGIKDYLHKQRSDFYVQYIEAEKLTEFSDAMFQITTNLDTQLTKDIRFYLRRVIASPLNIIGRDYSDFKYLTVYKGHFGIELTYDIIYNDLIESADDDDIPKEIPTTFSQLFEEHYLPDKTHSANPLREIMLNIAKDILEKNPSAYVSLIVHYCDVKGLERIIRDDELIHEKLLPRINISGWKGLKSKETFIEKEIPHYVISSQYPSLSYNLRKSDVNEFIFISDKKGLEGIKEVISKRLLETFAHPLYLPDKTRSMPSLIAEALDTIDIPEPGRVAEIYDDIDDEEISFSISTQSQNSVQRSVDDVNPNVCGIEPGNEAFLCIDNQNRGIFFSVGQNVMIRKDGFFSDIETDNRRSDNLIIKDLTGAEIILGKSGVYYSFKAIFFKFMMKEGARITFRKEPYSWKGFKNLFETSVFWIHLIEKATEIIAEERSIFFDEALTFISGQLTNAGITAKELATVIGWCNHHEEITLESGTYQLYRTEHPFKRNDLRIIFEVLNSITPGIIPNNCDSDEIFAAALCIQNLRLKVFKKTSDKMDAVYQQIRIGLAREFDNFISEADIIIPIVVKRVIVSKSVKSMHTYDNYNDLL